jgi:NADH dehydrogenase
MLEFPIAPEAQSGSRSPDGGEAVFDLRIGNKGARPRIVVVGAGFGGITATGELARSGIDVFLIDRNNYHTFTPLLYQVAAAEIEPGQVAYPVRSILHKYVSANFVLGNVVNIDFDRQLVRTDELTIYYDYLVLATGSVTHFYGIPGAEEYTFQVKNLDQANDLRNKILSCFEYATHELDDVARRRLLTFAIVGGGPTGVEFAGAMVELIKGPLKKDFPTINIRDVRVILIEAFDTVLNNFDGKLRRYATGRLGKMEVDLYLGAKVVRIEKGRLLLEDGRSLISETIIWAVGVKADPSAQLWGLKTARGGLVPVQPTLQAPERDNVYVIGDMALLKEDSGPLPMLAPVAIQEGKAAARNIIRQISGKELRPFVYRDPGTLATIGRNAAVAQFTKWKFTGFLAWILWVFVHLAKIIGFRNRIVVLVNWAWDYFFFERAVRLIMPTESNPDSIHSRAPTQSVREAQSSPDTK